MSHSVISKAWHYINIVAHRADLFQLRTAMVRSENAALSSSLAPVHIITPTGSIQEALEIQIPSYYGHTAVVPTVSALEGHLQFFTVASCVAEIV